MGLKDQLLEAAHIAEVQTGRVCKLCLLILDTDDEEMRELLGSRRIGRDKLALILKTNGHAIGHAIIDRHRREGHSPV